MFSIWWLLPIGLLIITLIAAKAKWGSEKEPFWYGWFTATVVMSLILLLGSLICTWGVISKKTNLKRARSNVLIAQKKYQELREMSTFFIEKYPMEEDFLKALNTLVILKLPEIKSNELLKEQVVMLKEAIDAKVAWQMEITHIKKDLDWHSYWWFSLNMASTAYEDLQGDLPGESPVKRKPRAPGPMPFFEYEKSGPNMFR